MYSVYLSNKQSNGTVDETMIFNDMLNEDFVTLINPVLELESGLAGSFDFTVPPCNTGYNLINPMTTEVIVKKNNKEVWRGRVLNPESDFYNQVKVECEGELTYLNDTYQPQHEYKTDTLKQVIEGILSIHNNKVGTYDAVTQTWTPNASEPIDKIFYAGACFVSENTDPTGTDKSYRSTDYDTTLACLKKIADNYKGYFIISKKNGKRYLDFVKDFSEICQQRIDFGENLLDFTKSFKMEDLCTVAMPIGARVQDTDFTEADEMYIYRTEDGRPDGHEFNYLDTNGILQYRSDITDGQAGVVYFNEYGLKENDKVYLTTRMYGSENPLVWALCDGNGTVYSKKYAGTSETQQVVDINKEAITIPLGADRLRVAYRGGGQPFKVYRQKAESGLDERFTIAPCAEVDNENFKHTPGDIYLIYKPLYEKYGWHEKKLDFSNLKSYDDLWSMATYWLTHTQFEQMVLDVTALDLSYMNVKYDDIWINMNVPIYSLPHGLTDNLLLPCTKIKVQMGNIEDTEYTLGYTTPTEISNTQNSVNADLSKLMDQVPTYSDTFKAIQENSTAIINAMYSVGYVSFLHDHDTNPNAISAIVIANEPDPDDATKKWVWDQGGLGYQDRPNVNAQWNDMKVAITMNGTIMGDMIAAHTIFADSMWGGTLRLGHLSRQNPITGDTEYSSGKLEVYDDNDNKIASIEKEYGITSNGSTAWSRMNNGVFYGNSYNNPHPVVYNGQNVAGTITFDIVYDLNGTGYNGVDVRTYCFGINSTFLAVSRELDGPCYIGQHHTITVGNERLTFVKGILVEIEQINNGGE